MSKARSRAVAITALQMALERMGREEEQALTELTLRYEIPEPPGAKIVTTAGGKQRKTKRTPWRHRDRPF